MTDDGRTTWVLIDGENIDATLGSSILGRRPQPDERPRWDRILAFLAAQWNQQTRGLFFLNASTNLPMSFIQALLALGYQPIPLSGDADEKVVDIAIQRTLQTLRDRAGDVVLVSHDGDFVDDLAMLADGRRLGVLGFTEFRNAGFGDIPGIQFFDLEYDVHAFDAQLPRVRIIPIDEFDVELVDRDDPHARELRVERVHVVFEIEELDAGDVAEPGVAELGETEHAEPASVGEHREVVDEIAVVADEHNVARAIAEGLERPLDRDVDDLLVGVARQRDRLVSEREERLDERHRQVGRGVQEEQAARLLVPLRREEREDAVPPRALVGLGPASEDRAAERGVDVLAVDEHPGRAAVIGHAGLLLRGIPAPSS